MVWLEKCHLAFANCVFNLRFAAVPVGSCGDSWKLRRVAGEASDMTENALSTLDPRLAQNTFSTHFLLESGSRNWHVATHDSSAKSFFTFLKLSGLAPIMENWNYHQPERYSNFCGKYIKF